MARKYVRFGWPHKKVIPLCIVLLLLLKLTVVLNAYAQVPAQFVHVKVRIEKARFNGCNDTDGAPDIYFKVNIGDKRLRTPVVYSGGFLDAVILVNPISVDEELLTSIDLSVGKIPIHLEQWDADSFLAGADDKCNIQPGPKNDIDLVLDLTTCQISGDLDGTCDTTLGFDQDQPDGITFLFRISVAAPEASGLNIRCLHKPVWPQHGEKVTVTAEVLDGVGVPNLMPDNIEIWADNMAAPVSTATGMAALGGALQFTYTPTADGLLYRCKADNGGQHVNSGWRRVQIDQPAGGERAVKIGNIDEPNFKTDIIFIPDDQSYPKKAKDPDFLEAVYNLIHDGYYREVVFLENQDMINFWIALDTGEGPTDPNTCKRVDAATGKLVDFSAPPNWGTDYVFADLGVVVSASSGRDCFHPAEHILSVSPEFFVGHPDERVLLHETGHFVGLIDEYCCDPDYTPIADLRFLNVYGSHTDCEDDPLFTSINHTCQPIQSNACQEGPHKGWECKPDSNFKDTNTCVGMDPSCKLTRTAFFRLDDIDTLKNDLMVHNGKLQAADLRAFNEYFRACREENEGQC